MAVGVVTNTEIEDATPAAVVAHTRRRGTYDEIVEQFYAAQPDVLMGGGSAHFLPKSIPGGRRADETDYIGKFRDAGYAVAQTAAELPAAAKADKLLGLFHTGNMDGALDRRILKAGTVKKFPDQPDLTDQVAAALDVLSRKPQGFFLMVESGLIDKYTHALDMERAAYDTIMLDNAVKLARDWAAARGDDTLILVTPDHNHPISLIGTIDDDMTQAPKAPLRDRVGVYDKAGFPNYPKPDNDGYPAQVDVSRRLAIFSASSPDYYETFRPKLDDPNDPTVTGAVQGTFEPNERYRDRPGAMLRLGNLPKYLNASVHSGEDVILTATGPGSERVRGSMDNTEVFRVMVEALGLGPRRSPQLARRQAGPLAERGKLHPHDLGVDLDAAGKGAEAAVGAGDDVLAADHLGVLHDAVGDELRMLDEVRGGIDHAGDDGLAVRQLDVLPHLPLVAVARIGAGERHRHRLGLQDDVDDVLQRHVAVMRT